MKPQLHFGRSYQLANYKLNDSGIIVFNKSHTYNEQGIISISLIALKKHEETSFEHNNQSSAWAANNITPADMPFLAILV